MQIFIKILETTLLLEVDSNSTIMNIKEKIWAKQGIPVQQQILIFSGISLADKKRVAEYNTHELSTLKLSLRLNGGMLIYVRSTINMFHGGSGDGHKLVLDVDSEDTIRSIKETILLREGIPIRAQMLSLGGKMLENQKTVEECVMCEFSTLLLIAMPSG